MGKPTFRGKPLNKPEPFSQAFRNQTPQVQGRRKEKELARDLEGRQQPASGAFAMHPGDVVKDEWLIDNKYTSALSYRVTIQTLRKIKQEAWLKNKQPALVIDMTGGYMYEPETWALLPYNEFKRLLEERSR